MAVGVHPNTQSGEAAVRGTPRFAAIEGDLRGILRTPICGQHVHVGLPDEESAVRAHNGIRIHIPLLNAISANSPFWFGEDSGLASARTAIFRSYPRNAMAPAFEDFADFTRVTREVCVAAGIEDYTHIWWDARIHPGLGTVEVRAADAQFDLDRAAAIAALVHCLTRVESESDHRHIPAREALAESNFQAARYGLDAELLDRKAELLPARELGKRAVEVAGGVAGELGCERELEHVERILDEGNGADLQRRAFREGSMDGLLAFLEAETAAVASGTPADG
jgi:carboxylate-amine ligase